MVKNIRNILFYVIAAFYIFMMIDLFFRFSYIFGADRFQGRSYNLIPFKTIWIFANPGGTMNISLLSFANVNIYGNVAAFFPYGLYLQVIQKNKAFMRSLFAVIITSLAIEIIQFTFGLGAGDIDDVILNTIGGIIGILIYKILRKIFKEEDRTKTAITIFSLLIGVPVIFFYFTTVFGHLRL